LILTKSDVYNWPKNWKGCCRDTLGEVSSSPVGIVLVVSVVPLPNG